MVRRDEGPLDNVGWGPFALFGERKRLREAERGRLEELAALEESEAEAASLAKEVTPTPGHSDMDLVAAYDRRHISRPLAEMRTALSKALQEAYSTGVTSTLQQGSRSFKVSYWAPHLYTTNFDVLVNAVIRAVAKDEEAVMLLDGSTVVVKHKDELRAAALDANTAARFAATPELMKDPEAALAELDRIAVNDS